VNVEQTLTEELGTVARSLNTPPPPSATDLVSRAERVRTRRISTTVAVSGLLAAAIVGAVVLGNDLGHPDSAPPITKVTVAPLPTGAAPAIPYVDGSTLYVDGRPVEGAYGGSTTAGSTTLAYPAGQAGNFTSFTVLYDGARVAVGRARNVVISPDGTKVAWAAVDAASAHLVEIDGTTGRELGRVALDRSLYSREGREDESWETVATVGDDGTVTYGSTATTHTWHPGHAPVDVALQNSAAPPAGFPWAAGWDLAVQPSGWGAWLTNSRGRTNSRGVDGWINDGVTVQRAHRPGTLETIVLPKGSNATGVTWESATKLLVHVADDASGDRWHFLRCDITTERCEIAPTS
jgi:hypothetical protein